MSDAAINLNEATTGDLQMKGGLKPFTLGEILDRTIQIYRRNFLLFVGIALLPTLLLVVTGGGAIFLVNWIGKSTSVATNVLIVLSIFILILFFIPLFIATQSLSNGALTIAAVKMHEGEKIKVREALAAACKRGWRYIGTQFFVFLFTAIIPGGVFFGMVLLAGILVTLAGNTIGSVAAENLVGAMTFIGVIVMAVYIILAMIRLSLAIAACTAEELGPWQSIRRCFTLSKGSMGRIFLFGLLVYVLTMAITLVFMFICMIPFFIVLAMMHGQGSVGQQRFIGVAVLVVYYSAVFLAQVVIKPVYSIGLTIFYFDERVRKEGYDIEWMMKRAGLVDAAATIAPTSSTGEVTFNPALAVSSQSVPWLDAVQQDAPKSQPSLTESAPTESGGEA